MLLMSMAINTISISTIYGVSINSSSENPFFNKGKILVLSPNKSGFARVPIEPPVPTARVVELKYKRYLDQN